nr:Integrase, catalytic core [Ipomoea batatas]
MNNLPARSDSIKKVGKIALRLDVYGVVGKKSVGQIIKASNGTARCSRGSPVPSKVIDAYWLLLSIDRAPRESGWALNVQDIDAYWLLLPIDRPPRESGLALNVQDIDAYWLLLPTDRFIQPVTLIYHHCMVFQTRMKHLALDYFFVQDLVSNGALDLRHIPSST